MIGGNNNGHRSETSQVQREDLPLTRAEIEQLLAEAGGNAARLDLSHRNLHQADLAGLNLAGANLAGAMLIKSNLSGTNLAGANLAEANLFIANLTGADLRGADLAGARLDPAELSGTNLARANLSQANLSTADISTADISGANFSGADLSEAYVTPAQKEMLRRSGAQGLLTLKLVYLPDEEPDTQSQPAPLETASQEDIPLPPALANPPLAGTLPSGVAPEGAGTRPVATLSLQNEPLTAQSLASKLDTLNRLFIKCRLIFLGRYGDFMDYCQNLNPALAQESGLVVAALNLTNPPGLRLEAPAGAEAVAKALQETLAFLQSEKAPTRSEIAARLIERLAPATDPALKEILSRAILPDLQQI